MRAQMLSFNHLFNPKMHGGGDALYAPHPPAVVVCHLLKISLGNPYLKILDLLKLFVADALIKKSTNLGLLPLKAF